MNRRSFLSQLGRGAGALGLGAAAVALSRDGSALAARRGSPGPTTSCTAPRVRDWLLGPCYCPAANTCGANCCDLSRETCVAGVCQTL